MVNYLMPYILFNKLLKPHFCGCNWKDSSVSGVGEIFSVIFTNLCSHGNWHEVDVNKSRMT